MADAFNVVMRIVSTLIGLVMMVSGSVWVLQGLNIAFLTGFMVGDYHWVIYGGITALVGLCQVIWSNTRQVKAG